MENRSLTEKPKLELPASLNFIAGKLKANKNFKPADIRRVIKEANVKPEDLSPWADFDHPVEDSYGRKNGL